MDNVALARFDGGILRVECSELFIDSSNITSFESALRACQEMRASFYVLGPLVARTAEQKYHCPAAAHGDATG